MTKLEEQWRAEIIRLGCIVCFLQGHPGTPGVQHHLTSGGRRMGHLDSICLCQPGHHMYAPPDSGKISRHPWRARFVREYGSEEYLLTKTRELVGWERQVAA